MKKYLEKLGERRIREEKYLQEKEEAEKKARMEAEKEARALAEQEKVLRRERFLRLKLDEVERESASDKVYITTFIEVEYEKVGIPITKGNALIEAINRIILTYEPIEETFGCESYLAEHMNEVSKMGWELVSITPVTKTLVGADSIGLRLQNIYSVPLIAGYSLVWKRVMRPPAS